jgi:predicted CXXCH cytochrome family protein
MKWTETGHANSANSSSSGSTSNSTYRDGICYTCHANNTVGADYFGLTASNVPSSVYNGTSCETCHGPLQVPVGPGHMPSTLEAEFCGECHSPYHSWGHGNAYEAWGEAAHATARETLLELPFEEPSCVHCHTAEGALPWQLRGVDTLAETANAITCPVCHDPHSGANEANLREAESTELCAVCHEHQTEVFEGSGHALHAECVTCHMFGIAEDYKGDMIAVTNHTMSTWLSACGQEGCHMNPEAAWAAKASIQDDYAEIYTQAEEKVTAAQEAFATAETAVLVNPEKFKSAEVLLEEVDEYWHDIGLQGSQGFHNPDQMEEDLIELMTKCDEVITLSEDAVNYGTTMTETATVSEFGMQLIVLLGLGSAVLIAALRRHRAT